MIAISQFSSPRKLMLLLIPFTWTSEWVMCFLVYLGSQETGIMEVEHPDSSIATLEKVVLLTMKVILMNRDRGIEEVVGD